MFKFEGRCDPILSLAESRGNLESMRQSKTESTDYFCEQFKAAVESYKHYEGGIGYDPGLLKLARKDSDTDNPGPVSKTGTGDEMREWYAKHLKYEKKIREKVRKKHLATMFLKKLYRDLYYGLHNMYSRKTYQYSDNLADAYGIAIQHKVV